MGTEFDIFPAKPIQSGVEEAIDTSYKTIASVEQSDLEFLIPADLDTYLDLDIKLYVKDKLIKPEGTALYNKDFTAGTYNFSQCSFSLNCTQITQSTKLYIYRAYVETLLTYGTDAAASHLTNAYWYVDGLEMAQCDQSTADAAKRNAGFVDRWDIMKKSKEIELYCQIQADICNVLLYLLSRVWLQIKFTKGMKSFFLMNKDKEFKVIFKFLDAHLCVKPIRPNPSILAAHNETLSMGFSAR